MSWELYFVLFLALATRCARSEVELTTDIIQKVFGFNKELQVGQAAAILPTNLNLTDHDDSDYSDNYQPAPADYDVFDLTLTKRVAASSEDNFLLSPLGLKLALAILTEAATGSTKSELGSVLGFDLDRNVVRKKFAGIIDSLQTKSSMYILNLGSRIYITKNGQPQQRFAAIAQNFYKTEIKNIDFGKPDEAANSINNWVSNITQGRIHSLVNAGDVAHAAVLILTTLYFKGSWLYQFPLNATEPSTFYVTPKEAKIIPYMNIRGSFFYAESANLDAKILRMPYLGEKFAMYFVVPNTLTGLPRVYNNLSGLRAELVNLRRHSVDVSMPKFKFDYNSVLDGILREMGIRQAFEDTASFPGLSRGLHISERLKVSKVLQQSGIEVNELGSTVYSVTEIALENKFGLEDMFYELVVNKPFMFFIQDEATRQLLFTGRVSDPSLVDGSFKN